MHALAWCACYRAVPVKLSADAVLMLRRCSPGPDVNLPLYIKSSFDEVNLLMEMIRHSRPAAAYPSGLTQCYDPISRFPDFREGRADGDDLILRQAVTDGHRRENR